MSSSDRSATEFHLQRYDNVWVVTIYDVGSSEHWAFLTEALAIEYGTLRVNERAVLKHALGHAESFSGKR